MAMEEVIKRMRIESTSTGVDKAASDINKVADAEARLTVESQKTERAALSLDNAFAKLERRYVEGVRQQQEFAKIQSTVNAAVAQNPALQERASAVLAGAASRLNAVSTANEKVAQSAGLARHEVVNLSRQVQDIGVSLASGQSPFTVLVQQGTQVADIFASSQGSVSGFFGQVSAGLSRVITPFRAFSAGITAGVATVVGLAHAAQETQREVERALMGIGRASGVTAADIERFANTSRSAYGLTVSEGRTAATAFAATGRIYGDNVNLAKDSVANFARVAGVDAAEATKILAKAYTDGAAGVDALIARLGHLDGRQRENLATLYATGRAQEAQRQTIQGVIDATQQAERALSPLDKALIHTKNLWDQMWEAAKRGANVVAGGNAPAGEDRAAIIRGQLDQARNQDPVDSRFFSPVSREEVRRLSDELKLLENHTQNAAKAAADARFKQLSTDADAAVRAIIPQIDRIRDLEATYKKLTEAQREAEISGRMGQAGNLDAAANAIALLIRLQRESQSETERQVAAVQQLSSSYANVGQGALVSMQGLTVETQRALALGNDQLALANARTGAEQMVAQQVATRNALVLQGRTLEEASLIAAQQRAIAQAQINAGAQRQLVDLQDQVAIAGAYNEQERISAQYVADRNALIRDGVNPALAEQVAQMKAAVAQQAEMVREAKEFARTQEEAARATRANAVAMRQAEISAMNAFEDMKRRESAIRDYTLFVPFAGMEISSGFGGFDWQMGKNIWESGGQLTQFNPAGYKSTFGQGVSPIVGIGSGQFSTSTLGTHLNQGGLTGIADSVFQQGGSVMDAINRVISSGTVLDQTTTQFLSQLTNLLPDDQKAAVIQQEIAMLRQQPATLARETLIKQLTDSLDSLKSSTDSLNGTMQEVLSPIYSTDPRLTHLGFRADTQPLTYDPFAQPVAGFQNGGEFTVPGGYSANDNMMVRFAARSGERVKVIPPGQSGDARPIIINQTINMTGNDRSAARETAFQAAQQTRRALAAVR